MIKAQLKRLHSPDIADLVSYVPPNETEFGFLLQVIAGPSGQEGEESFDVVVCTPSWLESRMKPGQALVARHHLIVTRYDHENLERFVADYCEQCQGDSWQVVAGRLGRLGKWEFEDYAP